MGEFSVAQSRLTVGRIWSGHSIKHHKLYFAREDQFSYCLERDYGDSFGCLYKGLISSISFRGLSLLPHIWFSSSAFAQRPLAGLFKCCSNMNLRMPSSSKVFLMSCSLKSDPICLILIALVMQGDVLYDSLKCLIHPRPFQDWQNRHGENVSNLSHKCQSFSYQHASV